MPTPPSADRDASYASHTARAPVSPTMTVATIAKTATTVYATEMTIAVPRTVRGSVTRACVRPRRARVKTCAIDRRQQR